MPSTKALGPDGMSAIFYQTYWNTVDRDVVATVQSYFRNGHMLRDLNHTFISLIPKKQDTNKVEHFRPISLCNVLYKVISKILANCLRPYLQKLISPHQAAFITGRNIAENVMLTQEIMHSLNKKAGRSGSMSIKLDMAKEYDRLECPFVEAVLKNMEFSESFNNLIMGCIRTTKFSVLINGGPMGNFAPSRGIRQGDPLSPLIFILCLEVLLRILIREEFERNIHGLKNATNCPVVSHLMFADDVVLFGPANSKEARKLLSCLEKYCLWSGQLINFKRSAFVKEYN